MQYHFDIEEGEVYCERHRPFPLKKEIERSEKAQTDDVIAFADSFELSLSLAKDIKKWKEKDNKELLYRVQKVYLQLRKLRITLYKDKKDDSYFKKEGKFYDVPKDWTITRSKSKFPWKSIVFKCFTPQECHS